MLHSPPRNPGDDPGGPSTAQGSASSGTAFQQQGAIDQHPGPDLHSEATAIEAVSACRLPPFWRAKPDLWFMQAEAALQLGRVRGDEAKYNLVLSMLDLDTLSDLEDIIRAPPAQGKFQALKNAILTRLTDSADRQLLKLFTQLELGDKRPSQFLRHMRGLSGNRVPDDVLRVKWLDLLPVSAQRLMRILKTPCLEELAAMADEIVEAAPGVAVVSGPSLPAEEQAAVAATRPYRPTAAAATRPYRPAAAAAATQQDHLAAELSSVRLALAQLIAVNREVLARLEDAQPQNPRRSPRQRSRPRSRSPSSSPSGGLCSYHRRWGAQAIRCLQPCSYRSTASEGN